MIGILTEEQKENLRREIALEIRALEKRWIYCKPTERIERLKILRSIIVK